MRIIVVMNGTGAVFAWFTAGHTVHSSTVDFVP